MSDLLAVTIGSPTSRPLHRQNRHLARRHSIIHPSLLGHPCPSLHPHPRDSHFGRNPRRCYLRPLHLRVRIQMVKRVVKSLRTQACTVSLTSPRYNNDRWVLTEHRYPSVSYRPPHLALRARRVDPDNIDHIHIHRPLLVTACRLSRQGVPACRLRYVSVPWRRS